MSLPSIPLNLDAHIAAEEAALAKAQAYSSFRWYYGTDDKGDIHVFRFLRGGRLLNFHSALQRMSLVSVEGPFKTRRAAAASAPASAQAGAPAAETVDVTLGDFQLNVQCWAKDCFGAAANDRAERGHRFVEEALEMAQAAGVTADEVRQLVDYVFSRPVGTVASEAGGTLITLAALCTALKTSLAHSAAGELARVKSLKESIRAKHLSRPKNSPLPGKHS